VLPAHSFITFASAILLLFRMLTGQNWNAVRGMRSQMQAASCPQPGQAYAGLHLDPLHDSPLRLRDPPLRLRDSLLLLLLLQVMIDAMVQDDCILVRSVQTSLCIIIYNSVI
jgi:hypothetical protein